MNTPLPAPLMRNLENRMLMLDEQMKSGTWHPTEETMTVILRHTVGILQALQLAIVSKHQTVATSS